MKLALVILFVAPVWMFLTILEGLLRSTADGAMWLADRLERIPA